VLEVAEDLLSCVDLLFESDTHGVVVAKPVGLAARDER